MTDKPHSHTPEAGAAKPTPAPAAKPAAHAGAAKKKGADFVKKHKFVAMAGAFLVIGFLMWGVLKLMGGKPAAGPAQNTGSGTIAVNVLEMKPDHFQDMMIAVGSIKGGSEIPLRFEVEGGIDLFEFRQGDKVRKGDIIARLSQRDAYLKLKKARLELEQMEKLYAIGGVSLNKLEEARVSSDLAALELEKTVLRSPRTAFWGTRTPKWGNSSPPPRKWRPWSTSKPCWCPSASSKRKSTGFSRAKKSF